MSTQKELRARLRLVERLKYDAIAVCNLTTGAEHAEWLGIAEACRNEQAVLKRALAHNGEGGAP